jgi:hypothetical protein
MVWDLLSTNCWQLCSMWLLSVKEEFCCCVTLLIRVRESRDYGVCPAGTTCRVPRRKTCYGKYGKKQVCSLTGKLNY